MLKSALMVSGDKEKFLSKIPDLSCDIAIVNLEDGVYDKEGARELVCGYIQKYQELKSPKIVVRVNDLEECGLEDIQALNSSGVKAVRIPKIKTPQDVQKALEAVDEGVEVHLSIETKEAFQNLRTLKVDERVTTVYLGILDLLASMKLPQSLVRTDNPTIDYILSKFLIDAKTAGFYPVSFVYQDYKNVVEFSNWCQKELNMGFSAKGCISPSQVAIANDIFARGSDVERARYVKKIFEAKQKEGISGFSDERYGFIDEPIYKDALNVLSDAGE
jgi:citrate lyase subunit beta/citryl-CoA lyase